MEPKILSIQMIQKLQLKDLVGVFIPFTNYIKNTYLLRLLLKHSQPIITRCNNINLKLHKRQPTAF